MIHILIVIILFLLILWTCIWAAACVLIARSEYGRHMTLGAYLLIYLLPIFVLKSIPSYIKYPHYYRRDFDPKKHDWPGKPKK